MTVTDAPSPATAPDGIEPSGVDPITFEVVRHKLTAIVEQQSTVLKAVSGSPLVTEANDCNTGIYLPGGEIASLGPHIVFHAGSMELVVRHIIEDCGEDPGINEGDSFITNDPYKGALHMPDVTMLEPVFFRGERIAWVGACAHMLDVGGMTPSSYSPSATEVYQEGLRLPPTKLVDGGRLRSDVWNLILNASRLPASLGLGLKAMIAANHHGKQGIIRLAERYGPDTLASVMNTMLDLSEQRVRERIRTLPDGTFRARSYLDHDGHENRLYNVEVELTKRDDTLAFDYSRSSPQAPGFINCTEAGLRGGVLATVLPVLCHDIPWNSGALRAVRAVAQEGLVVNAKHPAPCGSATLGGAWMVEATAGAALSQLVSSSHELRAEAMAVTSGSCACLHMVGVDQFGEPFGGALTEMMMGGGGATAGNRGVDFAGPHNSLMYRVTNVESDEAVYPFLFLGRFAQADSGGAGRQRGGLTGGSVWTPYDTDAIHGVLSAHGVESPTSQGIHGGMPGACNHFQVVRGSDIAAKLPSGVTGLEGLDKLEGERITLPAKPGFISVFAGDVVGWTWNGGGGWGDPLDADPGEVTREVELGLISTESAARHYGVVVRDGQLDEAASAALRAELRATRTAWPVERSGTAVGLSAEPVAHLGEHLVIHDSATGPVTACDCGQVLAPAAGNWKTGAAHAELSAGDLGPGITLHEDLRAHAYACPGCGAMLCVEIRRSTEGPLHDAVFAFTTEERDA